MKQIKLPLSNPIYLVEFFDENEVDKKSIELYKDSTVKPNYNRDNENNPNILFADKTIDLPKKLIEQLIPFAYDFIDERDTCYYCEKIFESNELEIIQNEISDLPWCVVTKL